MKNLVFIRANNTQYGGAEVYLSRLSNALTNQGIDHRITHSIFPKFLPSWLRAILFNIQVCITKRKKIYFSLDRITCPDIYRAGDGVHKFFLQVEKKSNFNPLHPVYLYLEKKCFHRAKIIIANSQLIKEQIINTYHIDPKKIVVIYNGIEIKEYDYLKSFRKLSQEFPLKEKHHILLYVGSGFKRKGVEEFLQIISKLNTPNITAFVIGKEKKINHYKKLALNLKINHQVFFTGPRKDVADFYSISDIFILPTHYEPFSNVVLEAMSFGTAVFTTRQNGASEILDSSFIMDSPEDQKAIYEIKKLLQNKESLQRTKQKNKLISKDFSIEKNMHNTLKILQEVINE